MSRWIHMPHEMCDGIQAAQHAKSRLCKTLTACAKHLAHQRYEEASLQASLRTNIPPRLAQRLWTSLDRGGWTPNREVTVRIDDIDPENAPRKYAMMAVGIAAALSQLSHDDVLTDCCKAYHESCDAYEEAIESHVRLVHAHVLAATRVPLSIK